MPAHISGVDAVTPAIERTKQQLFAPFRFRHWTRLAVLSLLAGELTGGGGGAWSGLGNMRLPSTSQPDKTLNELSLLPGTLDPRLIEFMPWIVTGMLVIFALAVVFVYVSCVFRFVLFDAVLNNRCELMMGWRRYQRQGSSYFLWTIGFGLAGLAALIVFIGGPIYFAWLGGIFFEPRNHIALLVAGGLFLFFLAMGLTLVSAIASLFAKDFVVPVMALENVGVLDGWRSVLPILGAEKGASAIYVLMKIVLSMASAIMFGIIDVLVLLALLIPLGIVAVLVVLGGAAAGLTWNTLTLCGAVAAGGAVLLLLIYVMSFVSVPSMVFFQAYTLHFFAPRYPLLSDRLGLLAPPIETPPPIPGAAVPLPAS